MRGNGLFSTLTFSERRQYILFLLQERPRTLTEINTHFHIHTTDSLPRLRELEADDLVIKNDDCYDLTWIGNVAAISYKPFLDTINALEIHKDFWKNHDTSVIPTEFLNRIRDLKDCKVIASEDCDICESHQIFKEEVANSMSFEGAACIFIPEWIDMFSKLSDQRAPIKILITISIYEKIQNKYKDKLEEGLKNPYAHMYVCEDDDLHIAFATMSSLDENFFSFSMNYNNGHYDTKNDLVGFDPASVKWGKDLFQYYLSKSVEIEHPQQEELTQDTCSQSILI